MPIGALGRSNAGAGGERLRRSAAAIRSGLRRYPPELLASIVRDSEAKHVPVWPVIDEFRAHDAAFMWLGHASVVAAIGGVTMAVDPVLSERIGPRALGRTWGLSRMIDAPMHAESLWGVPLVMLTHAHFDHLDRRTLRAMASRETTVIVPPGCARLVPRGFGEVRTLAAGERLAFRSIEVSAFKPRHWGARLVWDRHREANMYAVEADGFRVLFAGDTALTDELDGRGPFDVAVFGIGAYEPWDHMHATPEQVWTMFEACGGELLLPVHHSTFRLSDEAEGEPMRRLLSVAGERRDRVLRADVGEVLSLPVEGVGAP